jgi:hypothetical protein
MFKGKKKNPTRKHYSWISVQTGLRPIKIRRYFGGLAKLRRVSINFTMSLSPFFPVEQLEI